MSAKRQSAALGDIIRPAGVLMHWWRDHRYRPIERVDIMHGAKLWRRCAPRRSGARPAHPHFVQGVEYRGRGRETLLAGKVTVAGNRVSRFGSILNPERQVREIGGSFELTPTTTILRASSLMEESAAARCGSRPTWFREVDSVSRSRPRNSTAAAQP
jgi:hypothetical protein